MELQRTERRVVFIPHNSKYFFRGTVEQLDRHPNRRETGEKSDTGVYLKVSGMEQVQRMTYSAWEKLPLCKKILQKTTVLNLISIKT